MARRSRKSRKNRNKTIAIVAMTVVFVLLAMFVMKTLKSAAVHQQPDAHFSIADYRKDGSRFASTGNRYRLEGVVENIENIGNCRLVSVSLKGQTNERLPLLLTADKKISTNLARNKAFIFDVSCRTGRDPEGKQVKGILLINDVTSK